MKIEVIPFKQLSSHILNPRMTATEVYLNHTMVAIVYSSKVAHLKGLMIYRLLHNYLIKLIFNIQSLTIIM